MEHEIIKLTEKIGTLIGTVNGINKRLDKLNGSCEKRDEKISALDTRIDETNVKVANQAGKVAIIVTLSLAFFTGIIAAVIRFFSKQ